MAESMEGVVTEAEAPKTENVEQKAIAGGYSISATEDEYELRVSLHQLHNLVGSPKGVPKPYHPGHGLLRPLVHES